MLVIIIWFLVGILTLFDKQPITKLEYFLTWSSLLVYSLGLLLAK